MNRSIMAVYCAQDYTQGQDIILDTSDNTLSQMPMDLSSANNFTEDQDMALDNSDSFYPSPEELSSLSAASLFSLISSSVITHASSGFASLPTTQDGSARYSGLNSIPSSGNARVGIGASEPIISFQTPTATSVTYNGEPSAVNSPFNTGIPTSTTPFGASVGNAISRVFESSEIGSQPSLTASINATSFNISVRFTSSSSTALINNAGVTVGTQPSIHGALTSQPRPATDLFPLKSQRVNPQSLNDGPGDAQPTNEDTYAEETKDESASLTTFHGQQYQATYAPAYVVLNTLSLTQQRSNLCTTPARRFSQNNSPKSKIHRPVIIQIRSPDQTRAWQSTPGSTVAILPNLLLDIKLEILDRLEPVDSAILGLTCKTLYKAHWKHYGKVYLWDQPRYSEIRLSLWQRLEDWMAPGYTWGLDDIHFTGIYRFLPTYRVKSLAILRRSGYNALVEAENAVRRRE
ncbi:hypothetical protein B0O99DRAFT_673888 [Bisporella sp. PMI_857]|nr:hypothetical protein B0O99DRAFT_673888 [Bisporella sp. PMI_857]